MEQLPEHILLIIFQHCDSDSIFNIIRASNYFMDIFLSSPNLLKKYDLQINIQNLSTFMFEKSLSDIPYKRITISKGQNYIFFSNLYEDILRKLASTVEVLTLKEFHLPDSKELREALTAFSNVKELHLIKCSVDYFDLPFFKNLKSVAFAECCGDLFALFRNQNSLEEVKISDNRDALNVTLDSGFSRLAGILPNFNFSPVQLPLNAVYFENEEYPLKIKKLDATSLTFKWNVSVPRLGFVQSQQGHLKELTIHRLPYDHDGGIILKFIIETMKLEKFFLGKTPLILEGKKQEVKKFTATVIQISSTFEMFRQFPSIQSLTLHLNPIGNVEYQSIGAIANPSTDLFENLRSLEVVDHSAQFQHFSNLLGLYMNCRNITRLSISTDDNNINLVLGQCLSEMTKLNEIFLSSSAPKAKERLEIIKNFAPNVKKLGITKQFMSEAMEFFGNKVEIVGI